MKGLFSVVTNLNEYFVDERFVLVGKLQKTAKINGTNTDDGQYYRRKFS